MGWLGIFRKPRMRVMRLPQQLFQDPNAPVEMKVKMLEDFHYDEHLAVQFAEGAKAQDIPLDVFEALIAVGQKCAVNGFLFFSRDKGDRLDFSRVGLIMRRRGLRFLDENGEYLEINNGSLRARRIIESYAEIDPAGLELLALDKQCAVAIMAKRSKAVLQSRTLCQTLHEVSGFSQECIAAFCKNPLAFCSLPFAGVGAEDREMLCRAWSGVRRAAARVSPVDCGPLVDNPGAMQYRAESHTLI